ncbi:MAG TPA: hypothetical protein VIH43_06975 [Chthoniobacterales bacterium]
MNTLGIHHPAAATQLGGDSRPPIVRHLESDSLYRIPQIHIAFGRFYTGIEPVEAPSTHGR